MARKKASAKAKRTPAQPKTNAVKTKMSKTVILNELAEKTTLSRKQVACVLDELETLIERHIRKLGAGEFTLPSLLKIRSVKRPATKKRSCYLQPDYWSLARSRHLRVRVTALKRLKEMVG